MVTEMNDLIAAAQAGSEEALLELLQLCRPQLRRYANRKCASDDVEEAVQDALWLLYRRGGGLRAIRAFFPLPGPAPRRGSLQPAPPPPAVRLRGGTASLQLAGQCPHRRR